MTQPGPDIAQPRTALEDALANGRVRYVPPLPYRTRLRLTLTRAVDAAAISLTGHGHHEAALHLWRATGLIREDRRQ